MWFQFFLFVVATWSITRLIVLDAFPPVAAARKWIVGWAPASVGYLVVCGWCMSFWVAIGVWAGLETIADWSMPAPVLWIFSARVLAGMLDQAEAMSDRYIGVE